MGNRIVLKFGGTSVGTAGAMRKASAIVRAVDGEAIVVVSAVKGTTDALIALGDAAVANGDWRGRLDAIMAQHVMIANGLGVGLSGFWSEIEKICQGVAMLGELSPGTRDRLQSFGERISATIFAARLRFDGWRADAVDASRIIRTDDAFGGASVDLPETIALVADALLPMVAKRVIPVVTGYIGGSASGRYTTLGRGGSDYSAAIVANAIDATELQIWTDVSGMFTADPRLVPEAMAIPRLSFAEASELAAFGAKVLHPMTIAPAVERNIPVRILNTFDPEAPGTLITSETRSSIKAVTSKKGITAISVTSLGMLGAYGFLAEVGDAFKRHRVVVDVLASSEVNISVTVDRPPPLEMLTEMRAFATVDVEPSMAIVCLVGDGIRTNLDALWKTFHAVRAIPVRMVSQGASANNITFVVAETDADDAVRNVFAAFFLGQS